MPASIDLKRASTSGWAPSAGEWSDPKGEGQPEDTGGGVGSPGANEIPDPEFRGSGKRARRRRFTANYKLQVLRELDNAGLGQGGRILRREGLFHSHVSKWRKERDEGVVAGLAGKKPGVKGPSAGSLIKENRKLVRDKERLQRRLKQAELIIEFQKKAAALLAATEAIEEEEI